MIASLAARSFPLLRLPSSCTPRVNPYSVCTRHKSSGYAGEISSIGREAPELRRSHRGHGRGDLGAGHAPRAARAQGRGQPAPRAMLDALVAAVTWCSGPHTNPLLPPRHGSRAVLPVHPAHATTRALDDHICEGGADSARASVFGRIVTCDRVPSLVCGPVRISEIIRRHLVPPCCTCPPLHCTARPVSTISVLSTCARVTRGGRAYRVVRLN
ncbi:hypothetical protein K438DRAFT_642768 [Mycena galopus ATCC 62051]|nr:hypothetical protein K438DRAFT_642768 [Mycena galopus ATCC 62051]